MRYCPSVDDFAYPLAGVLFNLWPFLAHMIRRCHKVHADSRLFFPLGGPNPPQQKAPLTILYATLTS